MRASGKPLTDGIPGFYTVNGFYTVLLPALAGATKQVANESWVLGARSELAPDGAEALRLERDVDGALRSRLREAVGRDAGRSQPRATALAGTGHARALYSRLAAIADARSAGLDGAPADLVPAPPLPSGGAVAEAGKDAAKDMAVTAVERRMPQTAVRLQPLAQAAAAGVRVEPPGKQIDEHYRELRDYVGIGPAPARPILAQSSKP